MPPSGQGSRHGRPSPRTARSGPEPLRAPRRRKSLGQHHLKDGRICRPLVEFLRIVPGDVVVEIGPGGGVLTRELLATGARVVAVELDLAWAFDLPRRALGPPFGKLSVLVGDALEIEWSNLPSGWKVAGNLPYNVGTVIVERFLRGARPGTRVSFLLQREVVERIVAGPGDEAYGALSVLVALRARATKLSVVKPGAFVPPPKVDSAFVGLEATAPPVEGARLDSVERVVRAAFAMRRKNLLNALGAVYGRERAREVLETLGLDPRVRAEQLRIDSFVRLASELELDGGQSRRRGGSSS